VTPDRELRAHLEQRLLVHRRQFLGLLAAGAGAVVLGACSDDGDDEQASDRGASSSTTTAEAPPAEGIDRDPFGLGVASGDPLPTGVILWTRLVTDLEDPSGFGGLGETDHAVRWEVASDEDFATIVTAGTEPAPAELGHSVHVDAEGLDPDTWYWYRFRIGDFTSPVGRTRTAPAEGAAVDQLTLAFASCQLRTAGHWTAYDHLVADEPDLVLFLGDYIYEYPGGEGDLAIPLEAEPVDLADYRVLYAAYKRDAKLQAAHAAAPWLVTWDDHEVENNYADQQPEKAEDQAGFTDRRRAAYQAYWEHQPLRTAAPDDDGMVLHRRVAWGDLAEFFVLDGRQHRSDQVCGDQVPTDRNECAELDDEANTMLGADQEAWLEDGLGDSSATWKVLAQQTVMKALVLGDLVLNVDQWDGYPAARRRLFASLRDQEVDNVIVLTGDIHAAGAADLRDPDAGADGPIVAHEMVGTSISSPGVDALGSIDLSPLRLAYANFADRGYGRCIVTPETWRTDFVVVDTIDEPTSDASVDASVQVTAGQPGIERL
jgi:alkaline phosphatase D